MQPLSVQAVSPEIQFRVNRRFIPPSQGLLATTDESHSVPELAPFEDCIQSDSAPQILGLKLLQLHHPPLPQQSAPHYPQTIESHQHKFKNINQSASKMMEEEKRHASSISKRQLSFNSSRDPTQPRIQTSERSRGREFSLLPPALPAHTTTQGLRLLHFQQVPQSNITFPKLPIPSSSRPATVIAAPMGEASMIKLLHIESGPKMASSTHISSRFLKISWHQVLHCGFIRTSVSVTDVALGSSFSPNDPSYVHGGVGEFSDREAECWRGSTTVAQSRPTKWKQQNSC